MEREKLKAKTAIRNKVVGEAKSKTKKQEELIMACGSKKGGSKKGGKTGKTGK